MREFKVVSEFEPSGDQQQAIDNQRSHYDIAYLRKNLIPRSGELYDSAPIHHIGYGKTYQPYNQFSAFNLRCNNTILHRSFI